MENATLPPIDKPKILELMIQGFNLTPFHRHISLSLELDDNDQVVARIDKKDELIGNVTRRMLHGGLISSVFDAVGGATCATQMLDSHEDSDPKSGLRRLNRLCTLDLSINYHAPAKADHFEARANIKHQGKSVFHVQMEMSDNKGTLIASASANYMY